jgi:hypothetical protein
MQACGSGLSFSSGGCAHGCISKGVEKSACVWLCNPECAGSWLAHNTIRHTHDRLNGIIDGKTCVLCQRPVVGKLSVWCVGKHTCAHMFCSSDGLTNSAHRVLAPTLEMRMNRQTNRRNGSGSNTESDLTLIVSRVSRRRAVADYL